jgi:hypothetical protein
MWAQWWLGELVDRDGGLRSMMGKHVNTVLSNCHCLDGGRRGKEAHGTDTGRIRSS